MILTRHQLDEMRENAKIVNSDLSCVLDYVETLIKDNAKLLAVADAARMVIERSGFYHEGSLKHELEKALKALEPKEQSSHE